MFEHCAAVGAIKNCIVRDSGHLPSQAQKPVSQDTAEFALPRKIFVRAAADTARADYHVRARFNGFDKVGNHREVARAVGFHDNDDVVVPEARGKMGKALFKHGRDALVWRIGNDVEGASPLILF